MHVQQIRERFLQYFERHGHTVVRSASLIPERDPTLFFTNAGMVQFKNVFTGQERRPYARATSVQKCMRVSGKHNDLENVGHTPRHHTFFEMLGNFSFGDYFKREAIDFAWEFLVDELGLDRSRLLATVYRDDDEAFVLWQRYLPAHRIGRCGREDNYWSMGDVGPNGPCAEIHWDLGEHFTPDNEPDPWGFGHDAGRYMEIWNLVFMQYFTDEAGVTTPLPDPCVDTGMGLERLAVVMQGADSNYGTDELAHLMNHAADIAGLTDARDAEQEVGLRVLADHGRAAAFLLADGVMPSNVDRGYVLRRVMRRAIRHGVKLGIDRPFLHEVAAETARTMAPAYPELAQWSEKIERFTLAEEETFRRTMHRGLERLDAAFADVQAAGTGILPGEVVFVLHSQDGFPPDLTAVIAAERGLAIDEAGYRAAMEQHRALSSGDTGHGGAAPGTGTGLAGIDSAFTGYEHTAADAVVRAVRRGDDDEVAVVLDATPFYAERGGQTGDTGRLEADGAVVTVTDTVLEGETIVHQGRIEGGPLAEGDAVRAVVHESRRDAIRRNHTATHLLHAALRAQLGEHVAQQGSLVAPDRLRFDFSHVARTTTEELTALEEAVNAEVRRNGPVTTEVTSYDDAVSRGAMALFGEKYGDDVRMVEIPGTSVELCGGTHCARTGDIGLFKILSEGSVAQGVRRIEAVTGEGAVQHLHGLEAERRAMAATLKAQVHELPERVERVVAERKELQRQVDELKAKLASGGGQADLSPQDVDGVAVIAAEVEADAKVMRDQADKLLDSLGSGVVVLGSRDERSARLVVKVSKDLAGTIHAGKLVGQLAADVGGKGGGRPDMAQAGGKSPEGLPTAIDRVAELIRSR